MHNSPISTLRLILNAGILQGGIVVALWGGVAAAVSAGGGVGGDRGVTSDGGGSGGDLTSLGEWQSWVPSGAAGFDLAHLGLDLGLWPTPIGIHWRCPGTTIFASTDGLFFFSIVRFGES
jgi:hypothetical protein